MQNPGSSLIAMDVGNSRIKIGRFDRPLGPPLPQPVAVLDLVLDTRHSCAIDSDRLHHWCREHAGGGTTWYVASVFQQAADQLVTAVANWAGRSERASAPRQLTYRDVPLTIRVDEPHRVGIDRLLGALAADRARQPERPAIVIDLGTAITVDLVEPDHAFAGGAILPGIGTAARALHEFTAVLPHVEIEHLERPPLVPGKSTVAAIEAGLYWGAAGAVRELVAQLASGLPERPELFITGGASAQMTAMLATGGEYPMRHVPHLVLSGIALAAAASKET